MKKQLFDELVQSMGEALEHAQGKRELRTTILPGRPRPMESDDVRRLRNSVNASQAVFASYLNVSPQLVRAWESGRRRPEGAALRLLELASRSPRTVFGSLAAESAPKKTSVTETKRARASRKLA